MTYCFFPALSLGMMHTCSSANSSPPLRMQTWLISYPSTSMILIFRRLWTIPIWILFCYKRWASLSLLWKTTIGFWWRNQRPLACSLMFIFIFLSVIFWHSKRRQIATWGSRITSFFFFFLRWMIFFRAGQVWAWPRPGSWWLRIETGQVRL